MEKNSEEFIQATKIVQLLAKPPTYIELESLYGLYKQATIGNINIDEPSKLFFKEYRKWKAWNSNKNINRDDAEIQYIKLVNELIQNYGITDEEGEEKKEN